MPRSKAPHTNHLPPLIKPITVDLRAVPDGSNQPIRLSFVPAVARRARAFFDANPREQFYCESIPHCALARLSSSRILVGSTDHPPSHRYNSHRCADIPGPGPHVIVFNRDWPRYDQRDDGWPSYGERHPVWFGALLVANGGISFAIPSELYGAFGKAYWSAWEAAAGTNKTASDIIAEGTQPKNSDLRKT